MKKLLMGSIALTLFSISILLFQISCQKESIAQTSSGLKQLNKIIFKRWNYSANTLDGIYIANSDGSNMTKVNIAIPGATDINSPRLSPDGLTVFFHAGIPGSHSNIYSCNLDGSNVKKILDGGADQWEFDFGGAY